MYPTDRVYTEDHEWVRLEGEHCVIGITDFAQHELGDVVFVELPELGRQVTAHSEIGTIESVKAVADLFTPIAGEVVAVNALTTDTPELLNEDPHGQGWLVRLRPNDPAALEGLMDAAAYERFIAG
jgi:glycine cleavage system H protein